MEPENNKKPAAIVNASEVKKVEAKPGKKLLSAFFEEDFKTTSAYVFTYVIGPGIKRLIYDIGAQGLKQLIFGGHPDAGSSDYNNGPPFTGYNRMYRVDSAYTGASFNKSRRGAYDYENLEFTTRKAAEDVLAALIDTQQKFGFVSVGDLFEFSSQETTSTDYRYGWYLRNNDLRLARIIDTGTGYILKLPTPEES